MQIPVPRDNIESIPFHRQVDETMVTWDDGVLELVTIIFVKRYQSPLGRTAQQSIASQKRNLDLRCRQLAAHLAFLKQVKTPAKKGGLHAR